MGELHLQKDWAAMIPNDQRILNALRNAGIDYNAVEYDAAKPFRDNGIDSLDVMSLLLAIEEAHGLKLSEEEVGSLKAPADLSALLDRKLA